MRNLERHEHYARAFYAAIQPLLKDEAIPEAGLLLIKFLSARIGDQRVARELLFAVKSGEIGAEPSPGARRRIESISAFLQMKPQLKDWLDRALMSWLYAVSFLNSWWGPFLRLWLAAVDALRRREAIAVEYSEMAEHTSTPVPKAVAA